MIYNYYPGCTLSTKAKQLDRAARSAAELLGFPLVELPEWQCCGAVYPMAPDAIAERLSAVRALVAAKANGGVLIKKHFFRQNLARIHLPFQGRRGMLYFQPK
jgi:heterodisulfide reductase subunit B2